MSNLTALGFANPFTMDQFAVPKLLVFAVLLTVAIVAWSISILGAEGQLRIPVGWQLATAFLVLAIASAVFSPHWPSAFFGSVLYRQGLITILMYASLAWVCVQVVRRTEHLKNLTIATVAGGTVVAAYGLLQHFGLDPTKWGNIEPYLFERGFATMANPDVYAGYLVVPLCLAAALALEAKSNQRRALWGASAALLGFAVVTSLTRGAILGALVGILVLGVLWFRMRAFPTRSAGVLAGVIVAVVAIAVFGMVATQSSSLQTRLAELKSPSTSGAGQDRIVIWKAALATVAEKPLFGVGPDSLRFGWYRHEGPTASGSGSGYLVADDAHDLPLMLAATLGLPAALALCAFWVLVVVRAVTRVLPLKGRGGLVYTGWLAAGIALTVYYLAGIGFVGIGPTTATVAAALLTVGARDQAAGRGLRIGVALVGCALALASLTYATLSYASETALVRSYLTPGQEESYAAQAVSLAPWSVSARERVAEVFDQQALASNATGSELDPLVEKASKAYDALIAFEPAEYFSYVSYASFLAAVSPRVGPSAKTHAEEVLKRAQAVRPNAIDLTKPRTTP